MKLPGGAHLSYCSNIHPGESWAEVRANFDRHVPGVRDRLAHEGPFGIGLRLSARAAEELSEPAALAEFQAFLARERLYVFTINAFPYGPFHGQRVKDEVYLPDWRDEERLRYTNLAADLMAALLPADDAALEGSVSTVPGAFKAALRGEADAAAMAELMVRHAAHLVALKARTGRTVTLALEPEPACFIETLDEALAFFAQHLHGEAAARRLAEFSGLDVAAAREALRNHLGLCLDLCHAAVEFEDAASGLRRLAEAGIRITKMQISAGLRLPVLDEDALAALRRFDDAVYLHQVVQRGPDGLRRFTDLPEAFASLGRERGALEWRVHFHVPIFLEQLPPFASTQPFVREVLALQRRQAVSAHLEVETYTWAVLPEAFRSGPVEAAIARELDWVRAQLA